VGPVSDIYTPRQPVDLRLTLGPLQRGRLDPTMRWDAGAVWRTMRTPDGPATLHLQGTREIKATAWGPGAEWAIAGVPELLGADDDWSGLELETQPVLAEVLRRSPGLRLTRARLVMEMLLPAVLEQKVTVVEAHRAWRYLIDRHGDEAPGPAPLGMRVFPSTGVWLRVPSWEWHRAGVGPQRSDTVMRCLRVAAPLERTLDRGMGGLDVERALRSIPGIGVWTAAETMQRAHGDPDAVSVGDFHLANHVGWALVGRRIDDAEMVALLEPWRGQRQRICRLVWTSGITAPRHGPKLTIQDHRRQ
jgi:3-methyladenine DNA glycosylase/8-oxoguanine DNA glycosylase